MTDFQKSLTRFMYIALIVIAGVGVWAVTKHQARNTNLGQYGDYRRGVTATGTCVVRTKPELVEVTIGVRRTEATAGAATGYVKPRIRKVIGVLTGAGIAPKDIQTQYFQLVPQWDSWHHAVNWSADEELRVRIRKTDDVASIIDQAVKAGANQVGNLQFTVEDVNALRAKGRAKAAKVARTKAAQLASALGGKLGRLTSVNEYYPGEYGDYYGYGGYGGYSARSNVQAVVNEPSAADTAREEITIQPGEMTLTVVVSATYELI